MKTVTASDAKRQFGELLMDAQRGPVAISKNGKPAAVLVSAENYEAVEAWKLEAGKPERNFGEVTRRR